jgi:hypothetical protein
VLKFSIQLSQVVTLLKKSENQESFGNKNKAKEKNSRTTIAQYAFKWIFSQ